MAAYACCGRIWRGARERGCIVYFCDKVHQLRIEAGLSQEAFANELGVPYETVARWEQGAEMPDLQTLLAIADRFGTSLDALVRDGEEASQRAGFSAQMRCRAPYEYKSRATCFGVPLVHVHLSNGTGRAAVAKGIFAIGDIALGVVALGGISAGLISFGGISLGLLLALGGLAAGLTAMGGAALGVYALGGLALGYCALGGFACAVELAVGGAASGRVAIGQVANGTHALLIHEATEAQMRAFMRAYCPDAGQWLIQLLTAACRG